MGSMTSWIGSGAGLVMIGIAMLIRKYAQHLPPKARAAEPWIIRAVLVLMFMGGAAFAVTTFGSWFAGGVHWALSVSGGLGSATLKLTALSLLLLTAFGLWKAWPHASTAAMVLPMVLAMFATGFFHDVNQQIAPKARHGSNQLSNWLGHPKGGK